MPDLSDNNDNQDRPRTNYFCFCLTFGPGIGLALGAGLGAAFGNVGLGIAIGMMFGAVFGVIVGVLLSNSKLKGSDG